jgi:uncharacterized protein YndB with AHSA1/START domain
MAPEQSLLSVRRSIHIRGTIDKVWEQFVDFEHMRRWWGLVVGDTEAGTDSGQWLVAYEPKLGGLVAMEVNMDGGRVSYGGSITTFEPTRELTFENDWMPNRGWLAPTFITLRLSPALGGVHLELFHHGFERTGPNGGEEHAGYEAGWGMTQLAALKRIVEG